MKIFLTLKHWQLFLLLIGIPVIGQFIMVGSIFVKNDPSFIFRFFPFVMLLSMGIFFTWFYALGTSLHPKLPADMPMNLRLFKLLWLIPVVYLLLFSIFIASLLTKLEAGVEPNPFSFALIVPLHFFSMFCIFYCLYFNAKTLKAVELQRAVKFEDFAGEFFLLWFFPVGIWILQPRINRLFENNPNDENEQHFSQ